MFSTITHKLTRFIFGLLMLNWFALGLLASRHPESQTIMLGIGMFQLITAIISVIALRKSIAQPIAGISATFEHIRHHNGDISAKMPMNYSGEIGSLADNYNAFSDNLCTTVDKIRRRTVQVALGSANLYKIIADAQNGAEIQEQKAAVVFQSSREATCAIDEIASHSTSISDKNTANLTTAKVSTKELKDAAQQIETINGLLTEFGDTVRELSQNSDNIRAIVTLVQEFSDQTNLLALNAAIEAARAGENGRGFAVVADEVRNLSLKVNEATGQISKNISAMSDLVSKTQASNEEILKRAGKTQQVIDDSASQFEQMMTDFERNNEQLLSISSAIEQLSATNKDSHQHVQEITDLSKKISADMATSQQFSEQLEQATEQTQELLSHFTIGFGGFESIIQTGRGWLQQVSETINNLNGKGTDIFDTNYQSVANTKPQKYTVSYMKPFETTLQPLCDGFLKERSEFLYAVVIDKNGYMPMHHSHVSKPMTGNYENDLVHSRHQKIYNNTRSEVRRAANTEPFLLQTYRRDTGEVINELSLPIYVGGRHWGAFLMGFKPEELLRKSA